MASDKNNDDISRREFLTGDTGDGVQRLRGDFEEGLSSGRSFERRPGSVNYVSGGPSYEVWHDGMTGKGRGPRNYQRSDQRIIEDINDRLCDNPYIDATEIDVEVSNGEVILSGTVNDKESKRLAEDIGDTVSGVKNVENRLRVKKFGM